MNLPPLKHDRAPLPYVVHLRGCDDSSVVFANKKTADEAVNLQSLIERTRQGTGCMPSLEAFKVTDLDLSSEFTEDHRIFRLALERASLLTEDERDFY